MSRFLLNSQQPKPDSILRDMQHAPIFYTPAGALTQENQKAVAFTPVSNLTPGSNTTCEIKVNYTTMQEDLRGYVIFDCSTSDGTNFPTFIKDGMNCINYLEVEINNSSEKLTIKNRDEFDLYISEYIKTFQNSNCTPAQLLADWRRDVSTFAGTQVTNAATRRFYIPLHIFLPFLYGVVVNTGLLSQLKLTIYFANPVTDANSHAAIALSNTTASAYNTCTFNNVYYMRRYRIVRDTKSTLIPKLSNVRLLVPAFERKVYTQAWNSGAAQISFKVSDITKRPYLQKLVVFVTKNVTAYNDATAGLKYSGFNYIKHKKVRLNTGNNETLDFIDTDDSDHQLRAHEIVTHRRSYANDLPVTCYTAADAFTTQFLYMTEIQFDDIVIENSHAEVVNQMNPNFEDYQITLAPGTSASFTSANIVVLAVHYDRYLWDEKRGMQISKMIDLNAQ
jgi:hypothetical protein